MDYANLTLVLPQSASPLESPNLADAATRERLTLAAVQAVVRLADLWQLNTAEVCALLGDVSPRTWFRIKAGGWSGALSQDTLTRISALVGIFKGLRILFSEPLADEWVRLPNTGRLYGGQRPIDAMVAGGIPKMLEVRRHVDAMRGGM
ncbi:MAG TPA: antitoxin Xre-like helix-turn-helix domain-containing protein [Chthoniobacterales bacterium]